jgi:pimeloyl-ACP methyl ester carboxylesterase
MRTHVGDIEIEYELVGPEDGEPIVLVAGVFQQLSFWPEPFLVQLADAGLRVLIHDNRDVGFSTRESRTPPDLATILEGDVCGVNYTLSDMAADTAGLIEVLGFESAHVLGHSMGGSIAQRVAIEFPRRVRSLVLFGTRPGDGVTGESSQEFLREAMRPPSGDPQQRWEAALEGYRICVAPEPVDEVELAAFLQTQADRAPNPYMQCLAAATASEIAGMSSSPTHIEELQSLQHPTLVIHGADDRVIAADGGERLAELIPNARLVVVEGMGHFPLAAGRWTTIADAVIDHVLKG